MTNSPKACKSGQRCEPASLKEAMHCQAHHSEMPLTALADRIAMNPTTLSNMVNPDTDTGLPSRHLPALLALTQDNPILPAFLAGLSGGVYYRHPSASGGDAHTSRTLAEVSDYLRTVAEAEKDGRWTRAEVDTLRREVCECITALLAHVDSVAATVAEPEPPVSLIERRRA